MYIFIKYHFLISAVYIHAYTETTAICAVSLDLLFMNYFFYKHVLFALTGLETWHLFVLC